MKILNILKNKEYKKIIIPTKILVIFVFLMFVLTIFSSFDLKDKYYCAGFAKDSYDCYFSGSLVSSPWSMILSTESSVDLSGNPSITQLTLYYIAVLINIIIGFFVIIYASKFKSKLGFVLAVFYLFYAIFFITSISKCYFNDMCQFFSVLGLNFLTMPWSILTYLIMSNIKMYLYFFFILLNSIIIYFIVFYIGKFTKKIKNKRNKEIDNKIW